MFSYSHSLTASPHFLQFWDYHGRTETQATPTLPLFAPNYNLFDGCLGLALNNASIRCLICQPKLPSTPVPTVPSFPTSMPACR